MAMTIREWRAGLDPVVFARDMLNFYPDAWQESTLRWSGKKLILNCSRQSGKSTTAALIALHRALFHPQSLIILVAASLRQSAELFTRVRYFRSKVSPMPPLVEDNKLSCIFSNGSRIVALPDSESTIRGYSNVSLLIIDEAARCSDDLYFSTLPMLSVSHGSVVLMSTPRGKRGFFFSEWTDGMGWEKIKVMATECPRITPDILEEQRYSMGNWWFQQEFMCEFLDARTSLFRYEDLMRCVDASIKPVLPPEVFLGSDYKA